jgi:hypothetical protein
MANPSVQKTFLLCVGCQKGGTTWLHDHLSHHPNADMGFLKEYHVFETLYDPNFERRLTRLRAWRMYLAVLLRRGPGNNPIRRQWLALLAIPNRYFRYFAGLVHRSESILLTGDISPSYAGLSTSALSRIRDGIEAQGLRIRVLFLMRDPVDRIVSGVLMRRRQSRDDAFSIRKAESVDEYVKDYFRTWHCEYRTRYDVTISHLESVFPTESIRYAFYEELFTERTMRDLMDFLGIPYVTPRFELHIGAATERHELNPELRALVFDYYRPTYDFLAKRFGEDRLRNLWRSYRELGPSSQALGRVIAD